MWLGDDGSEGPGGRGAMSAQADRNELSPARRRRLFGLGLLRALATTVVLVALYYLLPLDHITNVPLTLAAGVVILLAVTAWQVRAIIRARYPALRAVEALAATVPLFLLLFASAYFTMAGTHPANFSPHSLTRTDALYFTVTVFSTVGFGDITAASQSARLVVTAQMLLDLLVLGLGIRVFIGAVQRARQQAPPATDPDMPPGQQQHQNDG
jgi:voltage-gated potassium channel